MTRLRFSNEADARPFASSTEQPTGISHRQCRSERRIPCHHWGARMILALLVGDTTDRLAGPEIAGFYTVFTSAIQAVYLDLPCSPRPASPIISLAVEMERIVSAAAGNTSSIGDREMPTDFYSIFIPLGDVDDNSLSSSPVWPWLR